MKNLFSSFLAALALSLLFVSCDNDDITLKGTLSGTISNYSAGYFDTMKCFDLENGSLLGQSKLASEGKFSLNLSTPVLNKLSTLSTMTVSDPEARIGMVVNFGVYKNDVQKGMLVKCNNLFDARSDLNGSAICIFMYSDRKCSISGTENKITFKLKLEKGWNEVMAKKISDTNEVYTTTPDNGLEWHCFYNVTPQYIQKKVRLFD